MSERPDLVEAYLRRLDDALRANQWPEQKRSEILEEVSRHIDDGRAALTRPEDEASLRTILEQLGEPDEIAGEWRQEPSAPTEARGMTRSLRGRPGRWFLEGAAALVLLGTIAGLSVAVASPSSPSTQFVAVPPVALCYAPLAARSHVARRRVVVKGAGTQRTFTLIEPGNNICGQANVPGPRSVRLRTLVVKPKT